MVGRHQLLTRQSRGKGAVSPGGIGATPPGVRVEGPQDNGVLSASAVLSALEIQVLFGVGLHCPRAHQINDPSHPTGQKAVQSIGVSTEWSQGKGWPYEDAQPLCPFFPMRSIRR